MGAIQCEKHGVQILSFVSPKIAASIRNFEAPEFSISKIFLFLVDGEKSTFLVDDDFAKDICRKYHLESKEIVLQSEEDSFEVFCSLEGVCEKCLEEMTNL